MQYFSMFLKFLPWQRFPDYLNSYEVYSTTTSLILSDMKIICKNLMLSNHIISELMMSTDDDLVERLKVLQSNKML